MQRISRMEKRKITIGWCKWTLVPIILFAAFLADAWLNVSALQQDLDISILSRQRRSLEKEMHMILAEETMLLGIDHLTQMAEQMGFAPPALQQIETLAYREIPRRIPLLDVQPAVDLRVVHLHPEPISASVTGGMTRLAATPPASSVSEATAYPEAVSFHQGSISPALSESSDNELGLEYLLGTL